MSFDQQTQARIRIRVLCYNYVHMYISLLYAIPKIYVCMYIFFLVFSNIILKETIKSQTYNMYVKTAGANAFIYIQTHTYVHFFTGF